MGMQETRAETPTNSALRLHGFVTALKNTHGTRVNANGTKTNLSGFDILPQVLGLQSDGEDRNKHLDAMRSIAILSAMVEDVVDDVQKVFPQERQRKFYLQFFPGTVAALSPRTLQTAWDEQRRLIDPVDVERLSNLSMLFFSEIPEKLLGQDDFAELEDAIDGALELLVSSSLHEELRDFVRSQLLNVKRAVLEYRFRGARGLREAVAGLNGSLSAVEQSESQVADHAPQVALVTRLAEVVTISSGLLQIVWGATHNWSVIEQSVRTTIKLLS